MAILVGTEILINGQWLDIESSEALRFLQPLRDAAAAGLPGYERELGRIFEQLTRPKIIMDSADARSEEHWRSLGIRFSGLSTVTIEPITPAAARPTHPGCAGCVHYDHNPYLQCAVHPLGRPGEVCGDQC